MARIYLLDQRLDQHLHSLRNDDGQGRAQQQAGAEDGNRLWSLSDYVIK